MGVMESEGITGPTPLNCLPAFFCWPSNWLNHMLPLQWGSPCRTDWAPGPRRSPGHLFRGTTGTGRVESFRHGGGMDGAFEIRMRLEDCVFS